MNINDYFQKIYLITSYHTKDRLEDTYKHLNDNDIYPELFVAPLKNHFFPTSFLGFLIPSGTLSLKCAYVQLFQKCIIENTKTALFIEDDIILKDGWKSKIQTKWFTDPDWYILRDGPETHFFGMTIQAMRDYLNRFALDSFPIDLSLTRLQHFKTTGKFVFNDLIKPINTEEHEASKKDETFTTQKSVKWERKYNCTTAINTPEERIHLKF